MTKEHQDVPAERGALPARNARRRKPIFGF